MPNQTLHTTSNTSDLEAAVPARFYHEINLLRIEGHYFCFDPKEAARRSGKQEFIEYIKSFDKVLEKPITIQPDTNYGWPGVLAYKVLQAIFVKLSAYGYPLPGNVQLSNRELARLVGRKHFSGRTAEELFTAIMQLRKTDVWCSFKDKETGEWEITNLSILSRLNVRGNRGRVSSMTFYIEPSIVQSINKNHFFSLNYNRLAGLEPIAVALYKHLFYHFSNVFSQLKKRDIWIRKDYADICNTWLGGLSVQSYRSKIIDRLGTHLDALQGTGLITSYEIDKNKAGDGFNMIFHPGEAFFEDYTMFYGSGLQLELAYLDNQTGREESPTNKSADEVVLRFQFKRLGKKPKIDHVSEKDRAVAQELLDQYAPDEVDVFLDFALSEAKKTNYRPRTLSGIKQYLTDFETERVRRKGNADKVAEKRLRQQQERLEKWLEDTYEKKRDEAIEAHKKELSKKELQTIEAECRQQVEEEYANTPYMFDIVTQSKVTLQLAQHAGFPPFKEWKKTNTKRGV